MNKKKVAHYAFSLSSIFFGILYLLEEWQLGSSCGSFQGSISGSSAVIYISSRINHYLGIYIPKDNVNPDIRFLFGFDAP